MEPIRVARSLCRSLQNECKVACYAVVCMISNGFHMQGRGWSVSTKKCTYSRPHLHKKCKERVYVRITIIQKYCRGRFKVRGIFRCAILHSSLYILILIVACSQTRKAMTSDIHFRFGLLVKLASVPLSNGHSDGPFMQLYYYRCGGFCSTCVRIWIWTRWCDTFEQARVWWSRYIVVCTSQWYDVIPSDRFMWNSTTLFNWYTTLCSVPHVVQSLSVLACPKMWWISGTFNEFKNCAIELRGRWWSWQNSMCTFTLSGRQWQMRYLLKSHQPWQPEL